MICRLIPTPILALVITLMMMPSAHAQTPAKRPNILFIFTDDQRADTIAALGNANIKTPNLDRLAKDGVAFQRAYCMGSRQPAVCVPSRAMVMTGRTLFRVDEKIANQTSWPEMFARAGYVTFATGKWHNGPTSLLQCFPKATGIFFGGMGDPRKMPIHDTTPQRKTVLLENDGKFSIERFTDRAVAFLKNHKGEQPFLAYVAFNAPHDPRVAPAKYHDMYAKNPPPLPANYLPQHPFNNGEMTVRDEQLAPWPRTPAVVRQHVADYYACITFLDDQVGRIIDALKESGQYENTIIVFASDHGLAIGSHGLMGKQNLYDDGMRAPLLIAGPGIPKDQRSNAFAYLLDIFPTLGDLASVPAPEGSEGLSLAPVLKGTTPAVRDSLFTAYTKVQRSVRDDRWHLIVYPHINTSQLFDLQADPHETKDLAAVPEHAGEITRLTKLLQTWQTKLGDKQPLRSEKPLPLEFEFPKGKTNPNKKGKAEAKSPSGNATIRAKAGPSDIVITTTDRLAGAIHSLTWNGKEFINSTDHGRQLQSACAFHIGAGKFNAEAYNPTEAGSRKDGAGPTSTSKLLHLQAEGSLLTTKSQMAFWLTPGEKSSGDPARNEAILSEHQLAKSVRIGVKDLPHAIEYKATFTVPKDEQATYAQFEAVTGYMPPEFSTFWALDTRSGKLIPLDDGPGEQSRPVILATPDGQFAMGVYAPDHAALGFKAVGYGRWRFKAERVVKWNSVFRLRDLSGIAAGDYEFRNYIGVGTLEDVRTTLMTLSSREL